MTPIDLKDCTLFLIDGTGLNFLTIRIGEGNFSYVVKKNVEVKKSRGNLDTVRERDEEPMDVDFQFVWDFMESSGDEPPTMEEALNGEVDGWISASSYDAKAPFSLNIQIVRSLTCKTPTGADLVITETYNFAEFNPQEFSHSLKDAVVDCKGFCNRVKPTVVRS